MLSKDFVSGLDQWLTWYNYHRKSWDNMDLENKVKFQNKAIYGLFDLVAKSADEIARIDGVGLKEPPPRLWVPLGVRQ